MNELERLRAVSDAHGVVLGLMAVAMPGMREMLVLAAEGIDGITLFGPLSEAQREALKQAMLAIANPASDVIPVIRRDAPK